MTDPVPGLLNSYDISPEEKKAIQMQNFWGALMQGGMGLMAAGSRVSDGQRAQLLMQAAQPFANMGAMNQAMMQSASREKLNAAAAQRLAQQDQAMGEVRKMADDPAFQSQLEALNPAQRAIIRADLKLGKTDSARALMTPRRGEVPSGYRPAGDGLEAIPGGPADPTVTERLAASKRAMNEKAIPASVTKGIGENMTSLRKIDDTLTELNRVPGSVGGVGSTLAANSPFVGDLQNKGILGTGDPEGTKLRALIADIGSLKVHDRSGAAVTAAETPRLRPFIPSISDDAATVRKKLENFRTEYLRNLEDTTGYYNQDNGFKPYKAADDYLKGGAQPQAPAAAQPQARPDRAAVEAELRRRGLLK